MTLADLVRKYDALLLLRRQLVGPPTAEQRAAMRALAAEFPSCLRELDSLTTEELQARRDAAAGPTPPDSLRWMCRYHELMHEALQRRQRGDRTRAPDGRLQRAVFATVAAEAGRPLEEVWEAVLPLHGRTRAHRSLGSSPGD